MVRQRRPDESMIRDVMERHKEDLVNKSTGQITNPGHRCWQDIADELEGRITAKYAYTMVLQNRFDLWSYLSLKPVDLQEKPASPDASLRTSPGDEDSSEGITFSISFTETEWLNLTGTTNYNREDERSQMKRQYHLLSPYDWTDKVHEKFFKETRLPCAIAYKRAKILPGGATYLRIEGRCTVCNSVFTAIIFEPPGVGQNVTLDCTYKGDFNECSGGKKRKLMGTQKQLFERNLLDENKSASYIRRTMAKEIMSYGELEPSHLPSGNQLRIRKCRAKKDKLLHEDPVLALIKLKSDAPYNSIIHDIGHARFFIHYWSSTEINNYRTYCKKEVFPTVSIDATGGVVRKITSMSGRKTSEIFLYQVTVYDRKTLSQFSVGHMLSERHDNNSISHWLTEWLRSGIPIPKIAVCDQSKALLMAVARSFTQYSTLAMYLKTCSDLIMKKDVTIPTCMIRNDVNHVMHLISTWAPMKNLSARVKQFYMHCIGLIVQCCDFEDAKVLLGHIFTIALHEFEGRSLAGERQTACETSKMYLKARISGVTMVEYEELQSTVAAIADAKDDEENVEYGQINNEVFSQIQQIYSDVEASSKLSENVGDRDNAHHCPTMSRKILAFCKDILLWSAIMNPVFGYGHATETSASSESAFNDLKNRVFQNVTLPIRVDEFVAKHIDCNLGQMILTKARFLRSVTPTEQVPEDDHERLDGEVAEAVEESSQENWRGLNDSCKPPKKRSYLQPTTNIRVTNLSSKSQCPVIGILKNGNLIGLRAMDIDKQRCIFLNTCAFDSVVQSFCAAYSDSEAYSNFVDHSKNASVFFDMVSNLIRDGVTCQSYRKRGVILRTMFAPRDTTNIAEFDCQTTVKYIMCQLFTQYPSIEEERQCTSCGHTEGRQRIQITASLAENSSNNLTASIAASLNAPPTDCSVANCEGTSVTIKTNVSSHVIIEPYTPDIESSFDLGTSLVDIPQTISIEGKIFKIRAAINFVPPTGGVSQGALGMGHYVAYCFREVNNRWEKMDDLSLQAKIVRASEFINNCQLLLYTI